MSEFIRKAHEGGATTADDWNEHLLEAHAKAPGMTSRLFAKYTAPNGLTSYDMLAEILDERRGEDLTVLDLACGDGYLLDRCAKRLGGRGKLVGVDMSEAELNLARERLAGSDITLHCGRAQALPLADASVDFVLCHLAFMLMLPVEPAIQEIARVLRPGGVFAAVVSCPEPSPENAGLRGVLRKHVVPFLKSRFPSLEELTWGDLRTSSPAGLSNLVSPAAGFTAPIAIEDFFVRVTAKPESIWEHYRDTYGVGMLSDDERAELRKRLDEVLAHERAESLEFPLRKFKAVRSA